MDIFKKIDILLEQDSQLNESGVRNIKALSKRFKTAKIFFHKDLDGVTSAIAIKKYVEGYGIKVIDAEPIQYGGEEYAVKKTKKGVMNILVDFAHGKTMMNIHLDHHDGQVGFDKATQSVKFDKTPSNVQAIQDFISPTDIFPARDIKIISKVDTADFAKSGLTPDDIIRATFKPNKSLDVSKNHEMMGLVTNKLILSFKNKKSFLSKLVMTSKPSLMNMYVNTVKLAKAEGYKTPKEIDTDSEKYLQQRMSKMVPPGSPNSIKGMKNGQSMLIGTTIVQQGGGFMGKGNQYDRYTIFKLYPESDYLLTLWPMGLVQLSKNPFVSKKNPSHLGDLAKKILTSKFKSKLKAEDITLDRLKFEFERDIMKKKIDNAVGFTWADYEALYKGKIKGLASKNDWWPNMIRDISDKPYKWLSKKQKDLLKKITVNAWDVIQASSGGHRDITNMSGLNFLKDTKGFMGDFAVALAKEMKGRKLE